MPAVKTTVTELPESRVRVEAEVPAAEVDKSLNKAAQRLGQDLRMPGFRRGKVPPAVVIQRMGREAILDQAVRDDLGRWYVDAIADAGIAAIGDPDLDMSDVPGPGEPLTFSFEVGVRPKAVLGEYKGLQVPRREPAADEEAVDAELEQLRERAARLETAEKPAEIGDFVVMDFVGSIDGEEFPGGAGQDQLVELGSGRLVPGFEDQLQGVSAGEERTVRITFPDDYGAEALAGKEAQFAVTVKEVRQKLVPELDDDLASDAAGFDTLEELKDDIRERLSKADEQQADAEFREAVLDAAVANATVEVPDKLVHDRAHEMLHQMLHSLEHQGINADAYYRMVGKGHDEMVHEAEPDARKALEREAVLAAVIEAEQIEPSDGDVLDALQATAAQQGTKPEKLRKRLEQSGRLQELKDDLAQRRAVDLLAESAEPAETPAG